jgi:hypothetical protein
MEEEFVVDEVDDSNDSGTVNPSQYSMFMV